MTLLPAAVILVARGADRRSRADRLHLRRGHAPRRRRHVDRDAAARARGRDRRPGGDRAAAPALQIAIALAALVGMGTKAGVMPLHVVAAARASDRARAGVGADERRDDQGRDLRRSSACSSSGSASLPVWLGVLVLALGALSALGGVIYALFQHDLKRLLALHSIENIGIIVLGLGACLAAARARRRRVGGVRARGRAAAHAQPRGLQGAALPRRGRVRARGRLARARPARRPAAPDAVDRRRVPRRRDGDRRAAAAERLRLGVADAAGAAARAAPTAASATASPARSRWPRSRRRRRSRSSASSRSSGSSCSARRAATSAARRDEAPLAMRLAVGFLAAACVVLGLVPGPALPAAGRRSRRGPRPRPTGVGLDLPGTGVAAAPSGSRSRSSRSRALLVRLRGRRSAAPAPSWACGQRSCRALAWTSAGFTKPLRLVLEVVLRPRARDRGAHARAASCRRSPTAARCRS